MAAGQAAEVRPDGAVEDVLPQGRDGFGQRVDGHGPAAPLAYGVQHQGQGGNVVQMAVGQQHVVDGQHFIDREVAYPGTGINEDVLIHQESRGPAVAGDGAGAAEHADFHGGPVRNVSVA